MYYKCTLIAIVDKIMTRYADMIKPLAAFFINTEGEPDNSALQ